MKKTLKNVLVAGRDGMVGSALVRLLSKDESINLIAIGRSDLDLLNQSEVAAFFESNFFSEVYMAAAKVGGINANRTQPADFLYENMVVQSNVIYSAFKTKVDKTLFLGSSCIYPKYAAQPIKETMLMTGGLESTNEAYALAKISGLDLCRHFNEQYQQDFRAVMPTNLYGSNDNFNLETSHVLPALLRRIHDAKMTSQETVSIWGSGTPRREFLNIEDMASACLHVMGLTKEEYTNAVLPQYQFLNVGTGSDVSIKSLAEMIAEVVGYKGQFYFDTSMPDGTPRKLLDISRISNTGWEPKIALREGIEATYQWFLENEEDIRK